MTPGSSQRVTDSAAPAPRPRGRPRSEQVDGLILDATLDLMRTAGFAGMSIDQIAALAGVTRPTIYRRWRSKASLATAAINRLHSLDPPAQTGDTRQDLIAQLEDMSRTFDRVHGITMIGAMLAEHERHPGLLDAWTQRLARPRRDQLGAILDAGKQRGEVPGDLDTTAAAWMLVGAYYARYTTGDRRSRRWAARVVDTLLPGLRPGDDPTQV